MGLCDYEMQILVFLLCQLATTGTETCEEAVYDIKSVDSCPTSKDGWDQAAKNKKCTDIAKRKNCTHTVIKLLYVYHCVINAYLNETLEVCAPRRVIFGYCTEFNVAGRVIQRHAAAKCNSVFPKCDEMYNSMDAYKYRDCYELVYKKRAFETTTLKHKRYTRYTSEETGHFGCRLIIVCYVIILVGVLSSCVVHIWVHHICKNSILNQKNPYAYACIIL